jgi:steroid delta-isomerase-like uncharacterized protein
LEGLNNKDFDIIDELVAPDSVEHEEIPGIPSGREGMRQGFQMLHTAFPDLQIVVHDLLADEDKVVARLEFTGSHQGEFMGIPATSKEVAFNVIDIFRFAENKVVEHWGVTDMMALLNQLGAIQDQ